MKTGAWNPIIQTLGLLLLLRTATAGWAESPPAFRVTCSPEVHATPYSGRVYVMLSRSDRPEPRFGPAWLNPAPFFASDVKEWKPGTALLMDDSVLAYPVAPSKLPAGTYFAQAVARFNPNSRTIGGGEGNGYSAVARFEHDPQRPATVELCIDQVVAPPRFREGPRLKEVDMPSKLLSDFHQREVRLRAAVALPAAHASEPDRRFPAVYVISGFGSTHYGASEPTGGDGGFPHLRVVLDAACPLGHHVFADSANNGPWGRALVEELIPEIEKRLRAIPEANARFLTGFSSGGWSSLWLQVRYPDTFGGVWSLAPDPVDFRDFQGIDLYAADANLFVDGQGRRRPLARKNDRVLIWFQELSDREAVLGHGEQLQSFEAVFSPRGEDGKPKPLWDRKSGTIDRAVAEAWKNYDIRLILERDWKTLGPKLRGKLHVFAGEKDNYYLEGAVRRLQESLRRLGSDAVIEIAPGRDHSGLVDAELRARRLREMAEKFRNHRQ